MICVIISALMAEPRVSIVSAISTSWMRRVSSLPSTTIISSILSFMMRYQINDGHSTLSAGLQLQLTSLLMLQFFRLHSVCKLVHFAAREKVPELDKVHRSRPACGQKACFVPLLGHQQIGRAHV